MRLATTIFLLLAVFKLSAQNEFNFKAQETIAYAVEHNQTPSKSKNEQDIIAVQISEVKGRMFDLGESRNIYNIPKQSLKSI